MVLLRTLQTETLCYAFYLRVLVPFIFPAISSSIAASCNQDFYAKRKGSQRMLFPLSMKVKEANPRASPGRKPYLCLFSLEGSQSKIMRISQGHDVPLLPLHKIS